jgi:hypothetical protein
MEEQKTPEEVLDEHLHLSRTGNEEDFLRNYGEDSFLILVIRHPEIERHVYRGLEGIRTCYRTQLRKYLVNPHYTYNLHVVEGDLGLLDWSADSEAHTVTGGVDSYVIRDGHICAQTVHYVVQPAHGR